MAEGAMVLSEAVQPELFDGAWPVDPALEARAKEYFHTGKIACKDAERVERVCRAVLLRIPAREIARRERVGRETIDAMVAFAHETGKLRPLAQALLEEATEIAFLAGHALKEALVKRQVQPQCLGMVWGTATDKIQLLTHSATSIVVHKEAGGQEEMIRAAWAALAAAQAAARPADSGSVAGSSQVIDVQCAPLAALPAATGLATGQAAAEPVAEPASRPLAHALSAEGGRGVMADAAPAQTQGATPENFEP